MPVWRSFCILLLVNGLTALTVVRKRGVNNSTIDNPLTEKKKNEEFPIYRINRICADLCLSGLGGLPCGTVCDYNQVHSFKKTLQAHSKKTSARRVGGPRREVCALLCAYALGDPLCGCHGYSIDPGFVSAPVDWTGICNMFCEVEGLSVYGCLPCLKRYDHMSAMNAKKYVAAWKKQTTEAKPLNPGSFPDYRNTIISGLGGYVDPSHIDWEAWCHLLCEQGDGGLACNCDLNP